MTPSQTLSTPEASEWITANAKVETDLNEITSLIASDLYKDGMHSVELSKAAFPDHEGAQLWPSSFSGIDVIVNRITATHRDAGARMEWYEMLLAAGTYTTATFKVPDLGAELQYNPGTVVAICGRLLRHGVDSWEGGERICQAHYMRNNVFNRQEIQVSSWVDEKQYREWMSPQYLCRQAPLDRSRTY